MPKLKLPDDVQDVLPDGIRAEDLIADPSGRYGHFLHEKSDTVFSILNPPQETVAAPRPQAVEVTVNNAAQDAVIAELKKEIAALSAKVNAVPAAPSSPLPPKP